MKKKCEKYFFCLVVLLALNHTLMAQSKSEKQVAKAVESLKTAMIEGKREQLDAIASDALTYGHSGGKIEDKATFIETIASGTSDFASIDITDQTIQIFGKTAIVRNRLTAVTNDNGTPGSVKLALLLVFQNQNGVWKLIARQAVRPAIP